MIYKGFVTVLIVAIASNAMAAAVIVEDRAVHAAARASQDDQVASLHLVARRDDSTKLVAMLQITDRDQSMDSVLRDYLLETTIIAMSATTPTAATREAVSGYRNRTVTSFVRLGDEHGQVVVPLYDIAAAARLTIRVWDTFDANIRVAELLRTRSWSPENYLRSPPGLPDAAWREGTHQAVQSADTRLLIEQKAGSLLALNEASEFGALVLAMAGRLQDREMFSAVFELASPNVALDAVRTVSAKFAASEASEILFGATAREEVASAAVLALGKFAPDDIRVQAWLLDRLGHERDGGSAALALARVTNDAILERVEWAIKSDLPELTKLRAALVLRLSDSNAALALRADLLTQELSSESLREALR